MAPHLTYTLLDVRVALPTSGIIWYYGTFARAPIACRRRRDAKNRNVRNYEWLDILPPRSPGLGVAPR